MRLRIGSARLPNWLFWFLRRIERRLPLRWRPGISISRMSGYGLEPHLYGGMRRNVDNYWLLWWGDEPLDTPDDLCVPLPGEFPQPLDGWAYPLQNDDVQTGSGAETIHANVRIEVSP